MERISLMEMPIDPVTHGEALGTVIGGLARGEGGWVITPNLDHLRQYRDRPDVRRHFADADLVTADGMPLVWASRIQDTPLPERVAGSDLIWSLTRGAARLGASVYLVGGNPGTADSAARVLSEAAPGLEIAGTSCPPPGFEDDPVQVERVEHAVAERSPDLVYVGLPLDKQLALIPRLRQRLPSAWFLGLGVSFSFVCGDVRRAPRWMRATGLEWVWRLMQEPRRLARRYLVDGLPLAGALFAHALKRRNSR
jgi:N-acetylglucosaminyldiphosphoundecaprenol N-acetyl-beta-D-mannosaminyltransferase